MTGGCPASMTAGTSWPCWPNGQASRGRRRIRSRPRPAACICTTPRRTARRSATAPARSARSIDVRAGGGYVLAAGSVLDERAYPGNPGCRELVAGGQRVRAGRRQRPRTAPRMACRSRGGRRTLRTAQPGDRASTRSRCQAARPYRHRPPRPGRRPQRPAVLGGPPGGGDDHRRGSRPRHRRGVSRRRRASRPACAAGNARRGARSPRRCGEAACEPGAQPGGGQAPRRGHQAGQAGHRGAQRPGRHPGPAGGDQRGEDPQHLRQQRLRGGRREGVRHAGGRRGR